MLRGALFYLPIAAIAPTCPPAPGLRGKREQWQVSDGRAWQIWDGPIAVPPALEGKMGFADGLLRSQRGNLTSGIGKWTAKGLRLNKI